MTHFAEHYRRVLEFVQGQSLMVLSTVTPDSKPESATVEFATLDNFVIVFDTFKSFRKYGNLTRNPNVSVVVGSQKDITVQIEGVAQEVDGSLLEYYQWYYLEKIPSAKKFVTMSEIVWFRVVPSWVRYTDVAKTPWETFELKPRVVEIELRNLSKEQLSQLADDPKRYCEHEGLRAIGSENELRTVAKETLRQIGKNVDTRWFGYLAIDRISRDIVGACGFKGPPTEVGQVEIAYFTFSRFEGQGYGTEMARQLIAIGEMSSDVNSFCAHTQPSIHASSKILQKVGMHFVGEHVEKDDGKVWRWERHKQ